MIHRMAERNDAFALAGMARTSFVATFGALYPAEDLAAFLEATFGPAGLPAQIGDPAFRIRIAIEDGAIIGFAKLGAGTLPPPARAEDIELKQLYVLPAWQGAGIAATLMDWALAEARAGGAARMVLSVWAENHRARRFYARYGFVEVGRNPFRVGTQVDDDRIWSLDL